MACFYNEGALLNMERGYKNMKDFFIDPKGRNIEQVRRIGYEVVDLVVEQFSSLSERPVFRYAGPEELNRMFSGPLPQKGKAWSEVLQEIRQGVLNHSFYFGHPRYIGHMITQPAVPSIFIEPLIAALNQSLFLWEVGPSAAHLEKEVIGWLCRIFGYKGNAGGSFVAGGSVANLTALLIARNYMLPGRPDKGGIRSVGYTPVFFVSEYSHFSVEKAANFIGVGENNVIKVPADKKGRMDTEILETLIKQSGQKGEYPFCVVATAGSTVTGNIDPLPSIAMICQKYGLWFHVDAAFGGAILFSRKWRYLLDGIKQADSIAFDPHKWLYNPVSSATILLKDAGRLRALHFKVPYIEEPENEKGTRPNQGECTIQGTRAFDAIKLWICLKLIGVDGYGQIIDHCMEMTRYLKELIENHENLEVMSIPDLSILCFRYNPPGIQWSDRPDKKEDILNHINLELQKRLEAEGRAFISIATYEGKKVLRAVILNYCTQKQDINLVIQEVERVGQLVIHDCQVSQSRESKFT